MKQVSARVSLKGDLLFLRPDGSKSLSEALREAGFQEGAAAFIADTEETSRISLTSFTYRVAKFVGDGEPAEIVAAIEAWWDEKP